MKNWKSAISTLDAQEKALQEERDARKRILETPIVLLTDKESIEAIKGITQEIDNFLASENGRLTPRLLELGRLSVSFGSEERFVAGQKDKYTFSFGGQGWKRVTHSPFGGYDSERGSATTFEVVQRVYSEDKASASRILKRLIEAADSIANPTGRDLYD